VVELLFAGGILGALVGAAALVSLTPWTWLFGAGLVFMPLGLLIGVPAGLWYHVRLYRSLSPRGELGRGWWLHPTGLHGRLTDEERRAMRGPFFFGAAGFVVSILGCILFAVGAWRSG
jgi:hypothetical protein